jgi:hypothetical protein
MQPKPFAIGVFRGLRGKRTETVLKRERVQSETCCLRAEPRYAPKEETGLRSALKCAMKQMRSTVSRLDLTDAPWLDRPMQRDRATCQGVLLANSAIFRKHQVRASTASG